MSVEEGTSHGSTLGLSVSYLLGLVDVDVLHTTQVSHHGQVAFRTCDVEGCGSTLRHMIGERDVCVLRGAPAMDPSGVSLSRTLLALLMSMSFKPHNNSTTGK